MNERRNRGAPPAVHKDDARADRGDQFGVSRAQDFSTGEKRSRPAARNQKFCPSPDRRDPLARVPLRATKGRKLQISWRSFGDERFDFSFKLCRIDCWISDESWFDFCKGSSHLLKGNVAPLHELFYILKVLSVAALELG